MIRTERRLTHRWSQPLFVALLSIIFAASLRSQAADEKLAVSGARIAEFGLYQTKRVAQVNSPDTNLGYVSAMSSIELLQKTDHIPARINTSFGFRYIVMGTPPGSVVETIVNVIHPKTTNPDSGEVTAIDRWRAPAKLGETTYSGWRFSHLWEAMPGKWTIQIIYGGKVLTEKEFTIEKPKEP